MRGGPRVCCPALLSLTLIALLPTSAKAAQKAGADLLLVVTVKKAGKKYVADGKLIDVVGGSVVKSSHLSYKKGGAAAAGAALASDLVDAALSFRPSDGSPSADDD